MDLLFDFAYKWPKCLSHMPVVLYIIINVKRNLDISYVGGNLNQVLFSILNMNIDLCREFEKVENPVHLNIVK